MASILDAQCIAVIVNRSLDVIEYDYDTAKRHKRELVRDFGFPKQQVRLVGFDSEKSLYKALELAGINC